MKDLDKYRGCLVGGAAGDALGYAVNSGARSTSSPAMVSVA